MRSLVATCSDSDEAYLRRIGCSGPVQVIPNGFDRPIGEPLRRPTALPRIGFVGPFSHPPNLDGYDIRDGVELLLGDTAKAFAEACVRKVREPIKASAMADRALERFVQKWTWDAIAPRVWEAAEECLRRSREAETR